MKAANPEMLVETKLRASRVASLTPGFERPFVTVLPDGRLVSVDGSSVASTDEIRVVLNWFDELRQRVK